MPRGTEEWDSQISKRLQVPTKSHPELFSRKSRADRQHLSFLCPQRRRGGCHPRSGYSSLWIHI